jgi:hypothetical protein
MKTIFGVRDDWSSTVEEIAGYVTGEPHSTIVVDFDNAWKIAKKELDMQKPAAQAAAFVDWMLSHVSQIDLASAYYDDGGHVQRVLKAKRTVASMSDFAAVSPWLKSQNARQPANIWIRPADALAAHPIIMLDDLQPARAAAICRKYSGAAAETSQGNAQAWILCARPLTREERQDVARSLCHLIGSDPGAISEPRWGRLPGFRQRKPGKTGWTNLLTISTGPALDPTPHLSPAPARSATGGGGGSFTARSSTDDMSKREFVYACNALRAGVDHSVVQQRIAAHVAATGRKKSPSYPASVVTAALSRLR